MTPESPQDLYLRRQAEHRAAHDEAKAKSFRLGSVRAATFIALCTALLGWDVLDGSGASISLAVAGVLFLIFIVEIVLHRRIRREQKWQATLLGLVTEGNLRIDRDWSALDEALPARERTVAVDSSGHPFAHDLAVQGRASLARLLGPITSDPGRRTSAEWLLAPAAPETAAARAEAARELSSMLDERLTLSAHGRLASAADPAALDRFLTWAGGPAWILDATGMRVAAWILPAVLLVAVGGDVFLGAPPFWIFPGLVQLAILRRVMSRLSADFAAVEKMAPALSAYVPQLEAAAGWSTEAPALREIRDRLVDDGVPAHMRLAALSSLVDTVASRRNVLYAGLAPILLADVHLGVRLDRWRRAHGEHALGWLDALGELEALSGLGCLAHDHPDWTFPEWSTEDPAHISGSSVGHPLLAAGECVRNDMHIGPAGTFTLVTGSNMSGKSTFLRAVGTNAVLAGAGGPVCASALSLPRVRIRTSMSIEDSLSQGVSLFMAQLLRVRAIVDEARRPAPGEGPVLYLLDEMLHGTNSAERRIAARAILRHLLGHPAIGAVSTHDLALADAEDLKAVADPVHFRETVHRDAGQTRLDFDYLIRPGLAQTSNALALLEAVGLDSSPGSHPAE